MRWMPDSDNSRSPGWQPWRRLFSLFRVQFSFVYSRIFNRARFQSGLCSYTAVSLLQLFIGPANTVCIQSADFPMYLRCQSAVLPGQAREALLQSRQSGRLARRQRGSAIVVLAKKRSKPVSERRFCQCCLAALFAAAARCRRRCQPIVCPGACLTTGRCFMLLHPRAAGVWEW